MNSAGKYARLGSTGKFYCQGRLSSSHGTCCNGSCGPTNGCNCAPCMQLDIKMRQLPKGYFVNSDGYTARRGINSSHGSGDRSRFYCGRKVMAGTYRCDGWCGPTDGPNCRSCQLLQRQIAVEYRSLNWDVNNSY